LGDIIGRGIFDLETGKLERRNSSEVILTPKECNNKRPYDGGNSISAKWETPNTGGATGGEQALWHFQYLVPSIPP
jgi:hypothetical protein